ncbi:MAG: endolytic transglycosylase MltG [Patescibacteria group bacterium]
MPVKKKWWGLGIVIIIAGLWWFNHAPGDFRVPQIVTIEEGTNLNEIASLLNEQTIIGYPWFFRLVLALRSSNEPVIAGDYWFAERTSTYGVAKRMATGQFDLDLAKITIPEGVTVAEVAKIISRAVPAFDADEFVRLATAREGYLFPDTYFFSPQITPERVIKIMSRNFESRLRPLQQEITDSGRTLEQIVIMASLLEEEAKDSQTRKTISGILWKRFDDGMKLQVDAVFPYILNKSALNITLKDLQTDSPYNTYRYAGLPGGPISNPGLDAVVAALRPAETKFWYYLADYEGRTHFAVNFTEHKTNKNRYLR